MAINNQLAVLCLIACDDSYQNSWNIGDPGTQLGGEQLHTLPDTQNEPDVVPTQLMASAGIAFSDATIYGQYNISGWRAVAQVTDPKTGFASVIFMNDADTQAIVALTGTNGLNAQDWYSNLNLGMTQWSQNKDKLFAAIDGLEGPDGQSFKGTIDFTGQSLGGGLAQYALYDYAQRQGSNFKPSKVTLTTFNGFGGKDGLVQRDGESTYDQVAASLRSVATMHFDISNDIVQLLGGGYVNGQNNTYLLDFKQHVAASEIPTDVGTVIEIPAFTAPLDPVDAHRVEAGFYRGFAYELANGGAITDFSKATSFTPAYVGPLVEGSREIGAAFANYLNNLDHDPTESKMRLGAGILSAAALAPTGVGELLRVGFHAVRVSSVNPLGLVLWATAEATVPGAVANSPAPVRDTELAVAGVLWAAATAWDAGKPTVQGVLDGLNSMAQFTDPAIPLVSYGASFIDGETFLDIELKAITAINFLSQQQFLGQLVIDPTALADQFSSADWLKSLFQFVTTEAQAAQKTPEQIGELLGSLSRSLYGIGNELLAGRNDAASQLADWAGQIKDSVDGVFKSAGNAYNELTAKYADPLFAWGDSISSAALDSMERAFDTALNTASDVTSSVVQTVTAGFETLQSDLKQAEQTLLYAAQDVVLRTFRSMPTDPFKDPNFDPASDPTQTSETKDGGVSTYTLFLPNAAGQGGQKVLIQLSGDSGALRAQVGNQILTPTNGQFELTVQEGSEQASFSLIAAGAITATEQVSISATLVDANGNPTHQTHLEANLTVDAQSADIVTVNDIPSTGDNDTLRGGNENDHIIGGAGSDSILGGTGDNVVEGGGGTDVIFGGTGKAQIYATSKVSVADALDSPAAATGVIGSWIDGGTGDDTIIGDGNNDALVGGGGNDLIIAGNGNNYILAHENWLVDSYSWTATYLPDQHTYSFSPVEGDYNFYDTGSDTIYAGSGDNFVFTGNGDNFTEAGDGNNLMVGGNGDDTFIAGNGNDTIYGDFLDNPLPDVGSDYIEAGNGNNLITSAGGDATIIVGTGNDTIYGKGGSDYIEVTGGTGADFINADLSDDPNVEASGNNTVIGADGAETVVAGDGNNEVDLGDGQDSVDLGNGDNSVYVGNGDDLVQLGTGSNYVEAGGGNDSINAGLDSTGGAAASGDDTIFAGDGIDTIQAGSGNNYIEVGNGSDLINAGDGNNTIYTGDGADSVGLGNGNNYVEFGDGNDSINAGTGNNTIFAGDGNDTIFADSTGGGAGSDYVEAGNGDDWVQVGNGSNTIIGGSGHDTFSGGSGSNLYVVTLNDAIMTRGGNDTIQFDDASGSGAPEPSSPYDLVAALDSVQGGFVLSLANADTTAGAPAGLTVLGDLYQPNLSFEFGDGSIWTDQQLLDIAYTGNLTRIGKQTGDDTIVGFGGNDTLSAGAGNDVLDAGPGSNLVLGGSGNDTFVSGTGNDSLVGGSNTNTFVFTDGGGQDTISPYSYAQSNVVQFAPGILAGNVSFERASNGDLTLLVNGGTTTVTIQGEYPTQAVGAIVFGDGTVLQGAGLDQLPINVPDADGVLRGDGSNDTIVGTAGNDTFDGGVGNDLIEGAGNDTVLFGYGMGTSTVVDSGANTVRLDDGIAFSDLEAVQSGNDLVLSLRGTDSSLVLQSYFAPGSNQTWTVATADGATTEDVSAVLADTAARLQNWADEQIPDYISASKGQFVAQYRQMGYQVVGDGQLVRDWTLPFDASFSTSDQTTVTKTTWFIGLPPSSSTQEYHSATWTPEGGGAIHHDTASFSAQQLELTGNDLYLNGSGGYTTYSSTQQWATLSWQDTVTKVSSSFSNNFNFIYSSDPKYSYLDPNSPGPWAIGEQEYDYTLNTSSGNAVGQITGPTGTPASPPPSGTFNPSVGLIANVARGDFRDLQWVTTDNGDDSIVGGDIVQAGAGNDTIDGSQFIAGGSGNDTLLNGANIMPGVGNAYMDGGGNANRYLISTALQGSYVLQDTGATGSVTFLDTDPSNNRYYVQSAKIYPDAISGDFVPIADLYYSSIGMPDWISALSGWDGSVWDISLDMVQNAIDSGALPALPYADDYAALLPLYEAAGVPIDTLEFGPGVTLQTLKISWTDDNHSLELSWGARGKVDVALPGAADYGYGIEQVKFDQDGSVVGMDTLLAMAPARPAIVGTADGDVLEATRYGDLLEAGPGSETLIGGLGNDTLTAGSGDDLLEDAEGDNLLVGGAGDATLLGGSGNDTLVAGSGNDSLDGGGGSNTYVFNRGFGHAEMASLDGARFGAGITPDDVVVTSDGTDLYLKLDGTDGRIKVDNWFSSDTSTTNVQFADGTAWTADDILARLVAPFHFAQGSGQEVIADPSAIPAVVFDGLSSSDVTVSRDGVDLLFSAGSDQLRVSNWYADPNSTPEMDAIFGGDGAALYAGSLTKLGLGVVDDTGGQTLSGLDGFDNVLVNVTGTGDTLVGGAGNDMLRGGWGDDVLGAGTGRDFIVGGGGNDLIDGASAGDVIAFNRGDGQDTVSGFSGGTLSLGGGIAMQDLTFERDQADLVIDAGGGDSVRIAGWYGGGSQPQAGLQVFAPEGVLSYDLGAALSQFQSLQAQYPTLVQWTPADAWSNYLQAASGDSAIGGILAYQYATQGYVGLDMPLIEDVLANPDFGVAPQSFSAPGVFDFVPGGGAQVIDDPNQYNEIFAGPGMTSSDVSVSRDGVDLLMTTNGTDQLRVRNWYAQGGAVSWISTLFGDGSILTPDTLTADGLTVDGSGGNEVLVGLADFSNVLIGGPNDTLIGGTGGNTFVLNLGGEHEVIDDAGIAGLGISDTIRFGAGISASEVSFTQQGNDILLTYGLQSDSVVLKNALSSQFSGSLPTGQYQFSDGSHATYVNDGQGESSYSAFDAGGRLEADAYTHSDGSSRSDIYNADGSGSDSYHNADGGYGSDIYNADGSGSDSYHYADGSYGSDNWNADGSGSGDFHYADGSYYTYVQDALGDYNEDDFAADGTKTGDFWSKPDGSYGDDTFNADGSSSGETFNADGSYSTYTQDTTGSRETDYFDATGNLTNYSVSALLADGSRRTDSYDALGNLTGYSVFVQSTDGSMRNDVFAADGTHLSDTWTGADGSYGSDTFNSDGSSSGESHNPDGSYSQYQNEGLGDVFTKFYGADGSEVADNFTDADGSYGSDTFNSNGSSSGNFHYADGSYYVYTQAADGTYYENDYGADGARTGDFWEQPNGSHGSDTLNADGSSESTAVYVAADGSSTSYDTLYQPDGSYTQSWTASNGTSGENDKAADGSTLTRTVNADGSSVTSTYTASTGVYGTDYVNADGSFTDYLTTYDGGGGYQQSWTASNGSSGENDKSDDGSTLTRTVNPDGSSVTSTYTASTGVYGTDYVNADGSYTDYLTTYDGNGGYQQSWTASNGTSGENDKADDGSTLTLTVNADGSSVTSTYTASTGVYGTDYVNADGSFTDYSTTYDVGGGYQQSWTASNGTSGENDKADDGSTLTRTVNADGSSVTSTYTASTGVYGTDYVNADGSFTDYSTTYDAGGGYQQSWTASNDTSGENDKSDDGSTLTRTVNADGSSVTSTYTASTGVYGTDYVNADGSWIDYLTTYDRNGGYQQSWTASNASSGENDKADDGSTLTRTVNADGSSVTSTYTASTGVYGTDYVNADGSFTDYSTLYYVGGGYEQAWSSSDGSGGSVNVDASGTTVGSSWLTSGGLQGVDAGGNHLLLGTAGADSLGGGSGVELLMGGAGNDLITAGTSTNIVAFNPGDGQDTVVAGAGQNNSVSLGGDFTYDSLAFQKSGSDLVLNVGASDSLTFKDWYASPANQDVASLQVIAAAMAAYDPASSDPLLDQKVQTFDFQALVGDFDQAQAANPGLTSWALTNALLDAHLAGSDSAALGGDLAYDYGTQGNLAGFSVAAAETTLSNAQLGTAPQPLTSSGTSTDIARLK